MTCYKCGCGVIASKKIFYPIDPKGKGRRWACIDCIEPKDLKNIPADVQRIVNIIDADNKRSY